MSGEGGRRMLGVGNFKCLNRVEQTVKFKNTNNNLS